MASQNPLPRHKILHRLRGNLEAHHRITLRDQPLIHHVYSLKIDDPSHIDAVPPMSIKQANDCCNKTVPILICQNNLPHSTPWRLVAYTLYNWLYARWFRPYEWEPLEYPSSKWVDKDIFPEWSGGVETSRYDYAQVQDVGEGFGYGLKGDVVEEGEGGEDGG